MRQVRETLARHRDELLDRWRRQLRAAAESGFALDEETAEVLPELLDAVDRALERRFRARPASIGHAMGVARRAAVQGSLLGDFLFDAVLEELPALGLPEQHTLCEALSHASSEVLVRIAVEREERRQRRRTARVTRLAHDLRNSVTAARLAFDLLRRRGAIDGSRAARLLDESLARLRDCIDDTLLDDALAPGELRVSPFDLSPVLADARSAAAGPRAAGKNVKVVLDKPPAGLRVKGDPRLVRPALQGLLRAAVNLARPGATIRVSAVAAEGKTRVAVEVNGCRRLPRGRLPDLRAVALARRAAKAHGGSLHARRSAGRGCAFLLALPIGQRD